MNMKNLINGLKSNLRKYLVLAVSWIKRERDKKKKMEELNRLINELMSSYQTYVGFLGGILLTTKNLIENLKYYYNLIFIQSLVGKIKIIGDIIEIEIYNKRDKNLKLTNKSFNIYLEKQMYKNYGLTYKSPSKDFLTIKEGDFGELKPTERKSFKYEITKDIKDIIKHDFDNQKINNIFIIVTIEAENYKSVPLILKTNVRKSNNGNKFPLLGFDKDRMDQLVKHDVQEKHINHIIKNLEKDDDLIEDLDHGQFESNENGDFLDKNGNPPTDDKKADN